MLIKIVNKYKYRGNDKMIKAKILKNSLIFITFLFAVIFVSLIINNIKVNAQSGKWIYIDNSWRYYSEPITNTGWYKYNDNWYYLDNNGMARTNWVKSEGKWYYLDPFTGKMLTGWINDNGKWYYLSTSGEMVIGWLKYNGNLYYLNTSGEMVKDVYIGAYYFGADGTWRNR